ncbi:MAG: trigger factor [Candidatus Paceibacterota bacterium]
MTDDTNTDYDADIKKESGEAKIKAQIPWETFESYRSQALESLQESVSIDGFRDKKIPEKVLEDHVGEMGVISEMAQFAISDVYPKIVTDNKLQTIGRPDVKITKISKGNPLEFEAIATMMPVVQLPDDYLETAADAYDEKGDDSTEVEDTEVNEAIENIRQQWAQSQAHQKAQESGEEIDIANLEISDEDLPEIDDEFVQKISSNETVDEFKAILKENLADQKGRKAAEATRGKIIQAVVDAAEVEIPNLIIDGELDKMMAQFESDVARAGMEMDDYFEQADTTKEEMRDKWRPDAKRRGKTQLVLNKIAADQNIQANDDAVDEEVKQIVAQYEEVPEARARTFVRSRMINENTIEWLENEAKGKKQE